MIAGGAQAVLRGHAHPAPRRDADDDVTPRLDPSGAARRLDLPRSTVHRLVTALEAEGLVGLVGEREGYRPGPGLMSLGQAARD